MADNVLAQVPRKRYPTLDEQMRSDIVNYLSRLKSDFVTSGERAGQGLGQVIDDGNYLEGVPRVVLGGLGALSAPVSAAVSPVLGPLLQPVGEAVDTYVGQPVERATGYPADITNELFLTGVTAGAAPVLRPALRGSGNFLAKMGDAAEAGLNRVGYTARPQAGTFFSGGGPVKLADDEGLIAYHGSPHSFDKFSMDKIGTGEGAQAYGHGLYFAEAEDVAKTYRDALAPHGQLKTSSGTIDTNSITDPVQRTASMALMRDSQPHNAKYIAGNWSLPDGVTREQVNAAIDELASKSAAPAGNMYQVKINVKPDELLDWDKPLSEQPKVVQDLARQTDLSHLAPGNRTRRQIEMWRDGNLPNKESEPTGNVVHSALTDYGMNSADNAALTEKFKAAGIKGIRYKDAGSRGAEGGTYNYVVFDDSLITILKKYGIPMTAGAGGAMMVSGEAMPPELAAQLQGGT